MNAVALLDTLDGLGVHVTVTAEGRVRLEPASRVDPALLNEVRACKADLLAHLQGEAVSESERGGEVQAMSSVTPSRRTTRPLPDWAALSAQPGHCGSCGQATDAPDWGALMVTCSAPPSAFEAGVKPLALHIGHRCAAHAGRGYRAKGAA